MLKVNRKKNKKKFEANSKQIMPVAVMLLSATVISLTHVKQHEI